jgi:geranylgeranyl diphosphate synthase type I
MKQEQVILVDRNDKKIGLKDKVESHLGRGDLHRAFVVFIFDGRGKLLIQKRSKEKMLWPLYWECTIASHPREGENYIEAGERRLKEELGFTCGLKFLNKFQYAEKYKKIGAEREVCAVLIGEHSGGININKKEVDDCKWIKIEELKEDIVKNPQNYAPWLKGSFKIFLKDFIKSDMSKKEKIESALCGAGKLVNPVIEKILVNSVDKKFHELVLYQTSTGGKRIRPALAIVCCKMFGGKINDVLYPAAGLEILHNYTLIIDDLVDDSYLRRGKQTTWAKFGKSLAQCVGFYYPAAVFQSIKNLKNQKRISEIFAKTIKIVSNGEILDILFERMGREDEPYIIKNRYKNISEKDYLDMVGKKSAFLIKSSCEIGGICARAKAKEISILGSYGFNLGTAFQISDDILDIFGDEEKFGKQIGKDIQDRKASNIVVVYAMKKLPEDDKKKLNKIFEKKEILQSDIQEAINLIKKTPALEMAETLREVFIKKAKENLKLLPQNQWNNLLSDMIDFVANREK